MIGGVSTTRAIGKCKLQNFRRNGSLKYITTEMQNPITGSLKHITVKDVEHTMIGSLKYITTERVEFNT